MTETTMSKKNKAKHEIHKTVRDFCLKHKLSVGRDHHGHYYIPGIDPLKSKLSTRLLYSVMPTAKSGLIMLKHFKRYKERES